MTTTGEKTSRINITDVRVKLLDVDGRKIKAIATITLDNAFVINDLKVIEGSKGVFVAMPSTRSKDGTLKDIAHPINQETRLIINQAVLDKYEIAKSEAEGELDA